MASAGLRAGPSAAATPAAMARHALLNLLISFRSLEVLGMYVDIFLSFTSVVQRGVWQQCVWQQCVACCTWACTVVALVPSSSSTQAPALNEAGGMVCGDRHGLYSVLMMCWHADASAVPPHE